MLRPLRRPLACKAGSRLQMRFLARCALLIAALTFDLLLQLRAARKRGTARPTVGSAARGEPRLPSVAPNELVKVGWVQRSGARACYAADPTSVGHDAAREPSLRLPTTSELIAEAAEVRAAHCRAAVAVGWGGRHRLCCRFCHGTSTPPSCLLPPGQCSNFKASAGPMLMSYVPVCCSSTLGGVPPESPHPWSGPNHPEGGLGSLV